MLEGIAVAILGHVLTPYSHLGTATGPNSHDVVLILSAISLLILELFPLEAIILSPADTLPFNTQVVVARVLVVKLSAMLVVALILTALLIISLVRVTYCAAAVRLELNSPRTGLPPDLLYVVEDLGPTLLEVAYCLPLASSVASFDQISMLRYDTF